MTSGGNRGLAFAFGIIGALLLILVGVIDFVGGFVFLALGNGGHALVSWDRAVIYVVVGVVAGLFAGLGHSGGNDRSVAAGAILVVLALVGWLGLGFGGDLIGLLAALFFLISGILYLLSSQIPPT